MCDFAALPCVLRKRQKTDLALARKKENMFHDTRHIKLLTSTISVMCDAKRSGGMEPASSRQIYTWQPIVQVLSGLCAS